MKQRCKDYFFGYHKTKIIMRIVEVKGWTIDEHPNKDKVYEWIRENWHDLSESSVTELIQTLKSLQKEIGGDLDYSISDVPDRGEYIKFEGYDREALCDLSADDYPLTGLWWDYHVIKELIKDDIEETLSILHRETEWMYEDEQLFDLCVANEYEFAEDGSLFPY